MATQVASGAAAATATAAAVSVSVGGRLSPSTAALFVCDIQDKFREVIFGMPAVIDTTSKLVRSAKVLKVPIFVTEQYPLRLGHTVPELKKELAFSRAISKTKFSMYTPELEKALESQNQKLRSKSNQGEGGGIKQVLLCGIETHVCIMQTAIDLLERGYEVHVVVDGVSSQRPTDRAVGLQRLAQMGAYLCTSEMVMFQLCEDSKHPFFKQISAIAKEERPDQLPFNGVSIGGGNL